MPRNGVGGDRSGHTGGGHAWVNTTEGKYRQDYDASYDRHRGGGYGRNNYSDDIPVNGGYSNGGRNTQGGSTYGEDRRSGAGEDRKSGVGVSDGRNGGDSPADNASSSDLAAFEKRVYGAQQEMQQMVHDVTAKDNQKFDLIFGILQEIQTRQQKLEDSVRSLKSQVNNSQCSQGDSNQGNYQQHHQQQTGPQIGGQNYCNGGCGGQFGQHQFQMPGSPMNQQMNYMSPMGGQQFNGMMSGMPGDGSQGFFQPTTVVMAMPPSPHNGQMSYMQPMGMQGMQGMQPQQMMIVGNNPMTSCGTPTGCGGCVGGDNNERLQGVTDTGGSGGNTITQTQDGQAAGESAVPPEDVAANANDQNDGGVANLAGADVELVAPPEPELCKVEEARLEEE
jgi:hypothetical protein